jgi:hypothetical protein
MLKKNGRLVSINGTDVTVTGMDYDYPNGNNHIARSKFDITFDVTVNNQFFVIPFSNERFSNQNQYLADAFVGTGETFSAFLKEVESNAELKDKMQYSDATENAANEVIGAIAQSVYMHVQSHSPDQDEE